MRLVLVLVHLSAGLVAADPPEFPPAAAPPNAPNAPHVNQILFPGNDDCEITVLPQASTELVGASSAEATTACETVVYYPNTYYKDLYCDFSDSVPRFHGKYYSDSDCILFIRSFADHPFSSGATPGYPADGSCVALTDTLSAQWTCVLSAPPSTSPPPQPPPADAPPSPPPLPPLLPAPPFYMTETWTSRASDNIVGCFNSPGLNGLDWTQGLDWTHWESTPAGDGDVAGKCESMCRLRTDGKTALVALRSCDLNSPQGAATSGDGVYVINANQNYGCECYCGSATAVYEPNTTTCVDSCPLNEGCTSAPSSWCQSSHTCVMTVQSAPPAPPPLVPCNRCDGCWSCADCSEGSNACDGACSSFLNAPCKPYPDPCYEPYSDAECSAHPTLGTDGLYKPACLRTVEELRAAVDDWLVGSTSRGNISAWDVSRVTDMSYVFCNAGVAPKLNSIEELLASPEQWRQNATSDLMGFVYSSDARCRPVSSFDGDIGCWETGGVTSMEAMFANTPSFNQDLNNWDVSGVTSMRKMFSGALSFNQPVDILDVSSVVDFSFAFMAAINFSQPLPWDMASATSLAHMFFGAASFDRALDAWDVSGVSDMTGVFYDARAFNGNLGGWDTSSVTVMSDIFRNAHLFNHPGVGNWNVSSVRDLNNAFDAALEFNQRLDSWDVSLVGSAPANRQLVCGTAACGDDACGGFCGMFKEAHKFDRALNGWDVSSSKSFRAMFSSAYRFDQDLNGWDVSAATGLNSMFEDALYFNGNVSDWDVSNAENLGSVFHNAERFNGDVSRWNLLSARNFDDMFRDAKHFNGDVNGWGFPQATAIDAVFYGAKRFNRDVNGWNVSSLTSLRDAFQGAENFNQDLNSWETSKVTTLQRLFFDAYAFNGNIGSWDTSKVTNALKLFKNSNFSRHIGGWNLSRLVEPGVASACDLCSSCCHWPQAPPPQAPPPQAPPPQAPPPQTPPPQTPPPQAQSDPGSECPGSECPGSE